MSYRFISLVQMITRSSELGIFIPSMIPCVREKFQIIVFAFTARKR